MFCLTKGKKEKKIFREENFSMQYRKKKDFLTETHLHTKKNYGSAVNSN